MNENLKLGYVKVHRALFKHWIYARADYFKAWVWLIGNANWETKKALIGSRLTTIKRGEIITSIGNFAKGSGLSENQVRLFWDLLEQDKMIIRKSTSKSTKITIRNYDRYQEVPQTDHKQITNKSQRLKKVKNEKKEKTKAKKWIAFDVPLEERRKKFWNEIQERIGKKIGKPDALDFFTYWAQEFQGTELMRWEDQKTWSLNMRIATWMRNKKNFGLEKESAINKKKDTGIPGKRTREMKPISDILKKQDNDKSKEE